MRLSSYAVCVSLCVCACACVSSSRPGDVVQMLSNTDEDDESGNLVFREN